MTHILVITAAGWSAGYRHWAKLLSVLISHGKIPLWVTELTGKGQRKKQNTTQAFGYTVMLLYYHCWSVWPQRILLHSLTNITFPFSCKKFRGCVFPHNPHLPSRAQQNSMGSRVIDSTMLQTREDINPLTSAHTLLTSLYSVKFPHF